jgi:hypothetical protein
VNGARRIVALGVLSWLMPACYQTYTGIYFLNRSHEVSRAQAERIARDLGVALAGFGFSEMREPEGNPMVSFASGQRPVSPDLAGLAGSDARISVAVRLDRPSITIRDMSNTEETEFVKALKGSIERQLEANGIPGARFERQKDFLFY